MAMPVEDTAFYDMVGSAICNLGFADLDERAPQVSVIGTSMGLRFVKLMVVTDRERGLGWVFNTSQVGSVIDSIMADILTYRDQDTPADILVSALDYQAGNHRQFKLKDKELMVHILTTLLEVYGEEGRELPEGWEKLIVE